MASRYYDPEIETASRDELRNLQEHKLKALVQHAWDHSPFYKKHFQEANITPDQIRTLDDIKKLPFLTKEDLRKDQETHAPWGSMLAVPMTETQRVRPSLAHSLTEQCTCCGGTGRVDTPPTVVRRIERALRRAAASRNEKQLVIRIHPEVALYILEEEADFLRRMRKWTKLSLDIRDDPLMRQDEFRLLSGPAETDVTGRYSSQ